MNPPQETGTKANVRITSSKNERESISLAISPKKTTYVSGRQLLELRNRHFAVHRRPYEGLVIVIDELSGPEAGSLRVNVRFGLDRMVTFNLGWKNKSADVYLGGDSFRIELI